MDCSQIWQGIVIGGSGGAIAGIMVWLIDYLYKKRMECKDKKSVFIWLKNHLPTENGKKYRSTRAIASYTNLTEDRIRYICSIHKEIYLSAGKHSDLWGIYHISGRDK